MKFKKFFAGLAFGLALIFGSGISYTLAAQQKDTEDLAVQLIRNQTLKIKNGDTTLLIDPMLAEPGAYPGFPDTYRSELRNPLTPLPIPVAEILDGVDAVILTHTHLDHWDNAAQEALPKNLPIYVQDENDASLVKSQGFNNVHILGQTDKIGNLEIARTACQHGTLKMFEDPAVGKALGDVMGIVFKTPDGKKAYLAADTVWFKGVDDAIKTHNPGVIILNTGGAALTQDKFKENPEIIMDEKDVLHATQVAPNAKIVGVHMDAINHMTEDRRKLSEYTYKHGIRDKVLIPFDGETMVF